MFSIRNIAQCHRFSFFTTVDAKICLNLSLVLVKIEQCVCEKVSVKLLKKPVAGTIKICLKHELVWNWQDLRPKNVRNG